MNELAWGQAMASNVMCAVRGSSKPPKIEVIPHLELNVAAAAVVLEMSPSERSASIPARDWLDENTGPGRAFQQVTALIIQDHRSERVVNPLAEIVKGIANRSELGVDVDGAINLAREVRAIVTNHVDARRGQDRRIDQRVADFREYGNPLFRPIPPAAYQRADALAAGDTATGVVEEGVKAHQLAYPGWTVTAATRDAIARALSDPDLTAPDTHQVMLRIRAEDLSAMGRDVALEELLPAAQIHAFREIESASQVGMLSVVRLGLAAAAFADPEEQRGSDKVAVSERDSRRLEMLREQGESQMLR